MSQWNRWNRSKGWPVAAVFAAGVLLRFPPDRYGFYPRCPFHEAFGLLCPGCGATRAAAALLHGHLAEALHGNALFVAAAVAGVAGIVAYGLVGRGRGAWREPPGWMVVAGLAITLIFGVARNIA